MRVADSLSPKKPSDKLTEHFSLRELTVTKTLLDNTPPPEMLGRLQKLAELLERIRSLLGGHAIYVTSGYRSDEVNKAVGGATTSSHRTGYAVDFTVPGFGTPTQVCRTIAADPTIKFDQLIDERLGTRAWVHLSIDPKFRRQILTYRNGKYSKGLEGDGK